ncbi:unnamed protein product [Didymodactylos carnosus]|uniref:EGF-like domain-containing protein n=1 Tax=Didymodactylos carnosus TaxID=1234261 RepID=A0A815RZN7_9BILA|nr:unnamed protein product [Didymodactylos carnosus]CAF4349179.1 unnamed protein product [Didymodactylos carnosus]
MNHCPVEYPLEITRRFRCWNSSKCIRLEDICDGIEDCPLYDDEYLCPRRKNATNCAAGTIACDLGSAFEGPCLPKSEVCTKYNCYTTFCDMYPRRIYKPFSFLSFDHYGPLTIYESVKKLTSSSSVQEPVAIPLNANDSDYCNRGTVVMSNGIRQCLCSPSFYGTFCEYQSERLTIHLKIETLGILSQSILRFLICLLIENTNNVIYCEEIVHVPYMHKSLKYVVYLVYPRSTVGNYSVRVTAFSCTTKDIKLVSLWYFHIRFWFLPVNRLSIKINVGKSSTSVPCSIDCLHGVCMPYLNLVNEQYCLCDDGWSGQHCHMPSIFKCSNRSKLIDSKCICPLGTYGVDCNALFDPCRAIVCHHGGTCFPLDPRTSEKFYILF